MHITIAAISNRLPEWISTGLADYSKRFPPDINLNIKEISPARRTKNSNTDRILQEEATKIRSIITRDHHVIALDEKGTRRTTARLSEQLQDWKLESKNTLFIIGGPDGLDESLKQDAREMWSLSDFTLPHTMTRLLLVEQLYRASCILSNHPYHRE